MANGTTTDGCLQNNKFKFFVENSSFFRGVCIFGFFLKILPEIWDKKIKMHTRNECSADHPTYLRYVAMSQNMSKGTRFDTIPALRFGGQFFYGAGKRLILRHFLNSGSFSLLRRDDSLTGKIHLIL